MTRSLSGEGVEARLATGSLAEVRLLGVDAPSPKECGGADSRAALHELVAGRAVTLVSDPAHGPDVPGEPLPRYVDRDDGRDVGHEVIRRGWARVDVDAGPFARRPAYESAEEQADGGVWARCNGDFHLDSAQQRKDSARAFVRRYYRHLSARRFRRAWEMLGARRKAQVRPFRRWRAGYRSSRGVAVVSARPRLSGSRRAVVRVRLRARDRDVCSGALVRQTFAGQVVLAAVGDSWSIVRFRIRKTGGRTPRVSKSECTPRPQPQPDPAPSPPRDCQGYDPCLTPGPDYDCAGGSGNGPRYVDGPVYVGGSDPYGLDSDGDGVACES